MPPKKKNVNVKRSRTVKKNPVVEPTLKVVEGEGLKDIYYGIRDRVDAIRNFGRGNEPTKRFNEFLADVDGKKISKISVGRKPIVSGIERALNILSLGQFSKAKKRLKYDDIYHQYLVITYNDGTKKKLERNAVVESKNVSDDDLENIMLDIGVNKDLTTRDMINNAVKNDKENDFFKYNPETSNCVEFVREMVDGSDLLPQVDTNKVLGRQDSKQLLDTIPAPLRDIPLAITNIAAGIDKVIYGGSLINKIKSNDLLTARMILEGKI